MRPLSAVERFFERLFERPSTRLLGARVHPVHLLRRLERSMEHARRADGPRTVVPDRYTIRLHALDLRRLGPRADLPGELASGAHSFARGHGYTLASRPQVEIIASATARPGDVEVEATFSDPAAVPTDDAIDLAAERAADGAAGRAARGAADVATDAALDRDPVRTRVFAAPAATSPRARLVIREPHRAGRTVALDGRTVIVGRSATSDVVLADARASRRHARLAVRDGHLVLTDLGSTNGTHVNGRSVREVAVGEGDEIRIGDTVLIVAADAGDLAQDEPGPVAPRRQREVG